MSTEESSQYTLAIENQRELFNHIRQANERIEDKIVSVLQASGVIVGLVFAGSLVALNNLTVLSAISLFGLAALFVAISIATILALRPAVKTSPHKADWEDVFTKFIQVNLEQAYQQSLSNYIEATERSLDHNNYLAKLLEFSGICLALQMAVLILLLLVSAY